MHSLREATTGGNGDFVVEEWLSADNGNRCKPGRKSVTEGGLGIGGWYASVRTGSDATRPYRASRILSLGLACVVWDIGGGV